ncbi:hypothetical protein [Peribacillus butanolivorans]|uniref:hypothetical protein n=1 Tax=Peribacillus butanolivorans TaxID=421767 RepID=UPI0035DF0121
MKKSNVNVNVEAENTMKKFYIGATLSFDISIDVTGENGTQAVQEALKKLSEYAVAIPELKLQLHDGTVVTPKVNNWSNEDGLSVEEDELV